MAERRLPRVYLADLLMAALVCGLVLALVSPGRPLGEAAWIWGMFVVAVVTWTFFRQRRNAPTCEECGRRFIAPRKSAVPGTCPHCGQEQRLRRRMIRLSTQGFWGLMGVLVLLVVAMTVPSMGLTSGRLGFPQLVILLVTVVTTQLTMLAAVGAAIYRSLLMRPKARLCEACGSMIEPDWSAVPKTCPLCRRRHLRPDTAKKEQVKGFGILLTLIGMLSLARGALTFERRRIGLGHEPMASHSLVDPGVLHGHRDCATLWIFVTLLLSRRRLRGAGGALTLARKIAGREGELVDEGIMSIWYSGDKDPVPALREQARVRAPAVRDDGGREPGCRTSLSRVRLPRSQRVSQISHEDHSRGRFRKSRRQLLRAPLSDLHGLHSPGPLPHRGCERHDAIVHDLGSPIQ